MAAIDIPGLLILSGFKSSGCSCSNNKKFTKGAIVVKKVGNQWKYNGQLYPAEQFKDIIPTL